MALAGHVSRAHKSKSRKKEETKEEEETNSKQETDLTDSAQSQLVTPIPPSQNTTAMQPPQQQPVVAQSQPIPPSPQDFFNPYRQRPMYPAYYQQQPPPNTTAVQQPQQPPQQQPQQEQQNTKKYDPIEILFGLLSTPTVAEAVKMYLAKNSSNEGEDPIKQLAFQQMIEAWKEEHERARKAFETQEEMLKQMMAAFSLNSTKSYAKGLEEYYKGIGKVRAQKDSQKLLQEEEEEIQQPPADPLLQVLLEMNQKLQKLDKLDKLDKLTKKKKKNPQQTTQPQNTYTPPPTSSDDGVFVS